MAKEGCFKRRSFRLHSANVTGSDRRALVISSQDQNLRGQKLSSFILDFSFGTHSCSWSARTPLAIFRMHCKAHLFPRSALQMTLLHVVVCLELAVHFVFFILAAV